MPVDAIRWPRCAARLVLALLAVVVQRRRRAPAPIPTAVPKAFLNDISAASGEKSYELGDRPTIIGRLPGPDTDATRYIVIDEGTVGRRHALVEYKDHAFWVTDQSSLNGTFVNNARIEEPTRLKHGDRLRVHKHEFEFLALDMFETDRTMMSDTVFAERARYLPGEDDDVTVVREPGSAARGSEAQDSTPSRP